MKGQFNNQIYLILLFTLFLSNPARAEITDIDSLSSKPGGKNLLLGEFSSNLSKSGIDFEFVYTGEVFSNTYGGNNFGTVYLDNFDIIFNSDLERILGLKSADLSIHILGNHGGIPSELSGSLQGTSNIAAYDTWKIYQFWIQKRFFEDRLSVLAGLYDLNSEFDTRNSSSIFINPSHGIGPEFAFSGHNGPSIFPTTSLALRINYNFTSSISFKTALLDGIPGNINNPNGTQIILNKADGILVTSELNFTDNLNYNEFCSSSYKIGIWYYSADFEKITMTGNQQIPHLQKGNYGGYVSIEGMLFNEVEDNQGMAGFIRAGFSDKEVNLIDNYLGAGLIYKGLFAGRDDDILGISFAASHTHNNIERNDFEDKHCYEIIFELTYYYKLFDYLIIQPDLQFIMNPANCISNNYSLSSGVRLQIIF